MLVLPIKREWFDMIRSGEKHEEYREIKPYYDSRLKKYMPKQIKPKEYIAPVFEIVFRNGYEHNSPSIRCRCVMMIGTGRKEWGAIPGQQYYVLRILEILEVKNCV